MHLGYFTPQKLDAKDGSPEAAALLLTFPLPEGGQAAGDQAP